MFFAALPPEINSGNMYTGPGSGPMLAAAAAWDGLASELQATALSCSSIIASLTSGPWTGPSSLAMAAAATPYVSWIQGTAGQAAEAAAQATAAASAYEAAFAAHVPPAVIAANRAELALLMATNIFGQNSGAIAATEAQYSEMWAQDAMAMDGYAASSTVAAKVTAFSEPPQVANVAGMASQAAAAAQSAGSPIDSVFQALSRIIDAPLHAVATLLSDYNAAVPQAINSLLGPMGAQTVETLYQAPQNVLSFNLQYAAISVLIQMIIGNVLKEVASPGAAAAVVSKSALGAGLGGIAPRAAISSLGAAASLSDVSATAGHAGTVGALSVPPTWATATPAVRSVAAALSAAGPEAVPAAALGQGGLLSSMSVAGMLGSAFGAGAPSFVTGSRVRGGLTPFEDLKDKDSPDKLKRLVAQISEKPDSVQHHTVDQEGLDALLGELAKKSGVHAVHLSKPKGGKSKVLPADA
ncbi:hypothetical protein A5672_26535 [Mycobacterium alsense]|uniref:PPE family protein n=1 Tax=Mycobacterium alsense TaxID=324058 RepID=A0ABD6NYN0_9MYCO|nr:PPE family protein [Mycobacterium alsense]OBG31743.1 hypothetical protein A5672_26535 [Mycobacterium alsense]OBJ02404.1 hypothetical protein A5660_22040 [Mycobacterium alsense]